jgi:hypothetical protein
MIHVDDENNSESEKIKALKKKMAEMFNKIEDFKVLASTLQTEAPARDAYKAVFGIDKPELDPNTPQGMRTKNEMNSYMGKNND